MKYILVFLFAFSANTYLFSESQVFDANELKKEKTV
jgi:hypothetical protein